MITKICSVTGKKMTREIHAKPKKYFVKCFGKEMEITRSQAKSLGGNVEIIVRQ